MAETGVLRLDARVAVPLAACAAVELDKSDAVFDEAAGEQAVAAKDGGFFLIHAVELLGGSGLLFQIHRAGCFGLHLIGEFKAADAGVEFGVAGTAGVEFAVERGEDVELVTLALAIDVFRVVEILDRRAV